MFEIGRLTRLELGYVGETESRSIQIDVGEWLDRWPKAVIAIWVRRPDKTGYTAATEVEDGILTWNVTAGDVAQAGDGMAQIKALDPMDTGAIYKSRTVGTKIYASLEEWYNDPDAPDPMEAWANQAAIYKEEALRAQKDAKSAADEAEESAQAAAEAAEQALNAKETIGTEADKAINAAKAAKDSADQAATAMSNAEGSATAAAQSAERAEAAQEEAVSAAGTATEAAAAAGKSAETAFNAANAAETAAEDAQKVLGTTAPGIELTASDEVVQISNGAARPALSLVSQISAIQTGTGDPTPDNIRPIVGWDTLTLTRSGRNMLDPAALWQVQVSTGEMRWGMQYTRPGTYALHANVAGGDEDYVYARVTDGSGAAVGDTMYLVVGAAIKAYTVTLDAGQTLTVWYVRDLDQATAADCLARTQVQVEMGSRTAYVPGQSAAITAAMPETVYGGSLNWTTGVLTATHKRMILDGVAGRVYTIGQSSASVYAAVAIDSDKGIDATTGCATVIADSYRTDDFDSNNPARPGRAYIAGGGAVLVLCPLDQTLDTVDKFNAALTDNPVTIVYELASPYTVQLAPQTLALLRGENRIWSEAGASAVGYIADTQIYVDTNGLGEDLKLQIENIKEGYDAITGVIVNHSAEIGELKSTSEKMAESVWEDKQETTVPVSLDIQTGYYRYTDGVYVAEDGRKAAILPVVPGEEYILTAYLRSAVIAAIIFFDETGAVLSYDKLGVGALEDVTDYRYTVPDGAAQMVVQNGRDNADGPYLRKVKTVQGTTFYTKSESDERFASKNDVTEERYGVRWSTSNPDDLGSRCFAASELTATIGVGATDGQSDFDNIYPWSEMQRCNIRINSAGAKIVTFEGEDDFALDGSNGDVFVRIPRFGVEKYTQDGYEYRVITAEGAPHPAFVENGVVLNEIFVGAYEGYIDADSKLRSQAGVIPTSNRVAADYLAAARANSTNHTLYDMRTTDALWTLMAIEYGCRNASQVLGYGAADFMQANSYYTYLIAVESATATNSIKITGGWSEADKKNMPVGSNMLICKGDQHNVIAERKILSIVDDGTYMTITFDGSPVDIDTTCFVGSAALNTNFVEDCPTGALTWHTGRAAWDSGAEVRNPIRYRWVENVHGNLWHFLPDVTFDNLQMYVCDDMSKYEFCGLNGYRPVGSPMLQQSDNGDKADTIGTNYWIDSLVDDHFARGVLMGKSWNKALQKHQAFGAYYYLNNGRVGIVNGGGFDHLWRCNMLTQRAWAPADYQWYLVGARMQYKQLTQVGGGGGDAGFAEYAAYAERAGEADNALAVGGLQVQAVPITDWDTITTDEGTMYLVYDPEVTA